MELVTNLLLTAASVYVVYASIKARKRIEFLNKNTLNLLTALNAQTNYAVTCRDSYDKLKAEFLTSLRAIAPIIDNMAASGKYDQDCVHALQDLDVIVSRLAAILKVEEVNPHGYVTRSGTTFYGLTVEDVSDLRAVYAELTGSTLVSSATTKRLIKKLTEDNYRGLR